MLFLGKSDDEHCQRALEICHTVFDVDGFLGVWGDPLPLRAREWQGEYIVSYLSRWVVPERLLTAACVAAINFHPAPPEYPGIGCTNFALYDEARCYGVTCHHMAGPVDTGPIIAVRKFPLLASDDVTLLLRATYAVQFALFTEIFVFLANGIPLPKSPLRWMRKPYTRAEFNELGVLTAEMDEKEKRRRQRAVNFGPWKAKIV